MPSLQPFSNLHYGSLSPMSYNSLPFRPSGFHKELLFQISVNMTWETIASSVFLNSQYFYRLEDNSAVKSEEQLFNTSQTVSSSLYFMNGFSGFTVQK